MSRPKGGWIMTTPRKYRVPDSIVLDDDLVRRLERKGVLRKFERTPPKPVDPAAFARLQAQKEQNERRRREREEEDQRPLPDHRGRMPDHTDYGADD
jgi:hypothetical protein